jgi:HNH endonuclease
MPDYSLVPVDYQPDFGDVSLVPVDYDPFGPDDAVQQTQTQLAQTQPAQPQAESSPQLLAIGAGQPNAAGSSDRSRVPLTDRDPHPIQEAQWTVFVRPPVIFPRLLRPLEEIPPGSAGGPGAGKRFSPNQNDQPEGTPCFYCDTPTTRSPGPDRFNGDHNIPKSRGGNNSPENHIDSCQTCNLSKGSRTPEEWYEYQRNGGI